MRPFVGRVEDFQGFVDDAAPGRMPPELFQADEGGDLSSRGCWLLRRGQFKLGAPAGEGAIRTIYAFRTLPGSLAVAVVDDAGNFRGFFNMNSTGAPVPPTDLEGLGVGGFGEGEFGV